MALLVSELRPSDRVEIRGKRADPAVNSRVVPLQASRTAEGAARPSAGEHDDELPAELRALDEAAPVISFEFTRADGSERWILRAPLAPLQRRSALLAALEPEPGSVLPTFERVRRAEFAEALARVIRLDAFLLQVEALGVLDRDVEVEGPGEATPEGVTATLEWLRVSFDVAEAWAVLRRDQAPDQLQDLVVRGEVRPMDALALLASSSEIAIDRVLGSEPLFSSSGVEFGAPGATLGRGSAAEPLAGSSASSASPASSASSASFDVHRSTLSKKALCRALLRSQLRELLNEHDPKELPPEPALSLLRRLRRCVWTQEGGDADFVSGMAWHQAGDRLVSSTGTRVVRVWNPKDGACEKRRGPGPILSSLALHPHGRWITNGTMRDFLTVWNLETPEELHLAGHSESIRTVAWDRSGQWLASGSVDRTVRIWAFEAGRMSVAGERSFACAGHEDTVSCLSWHSTEPWLASGSLDHTVRVWDAGTGEPRTRFRFDSAVMAANWDPSPAAQRLAVGLHNGRVVQWDVVSDEVHELFRSTDDADSVFEVEWNAAGSALAWTHANNSIRIWYRASGTIHELRGAKQPSYALAWHPNGHCLASGGGRDLIRLWLV